ncbi:transcriptional repressor of the glutamine synthetase gene [Streptococcus pneumoniae]|nr:transcriptional repressor of the glutamine synthetase gene [Streptococcus pneumoniae]
MYSLNDMDRLLEIKDYISEGYNIAAIKKKYAEREAKFFFLHLQFPSFCLL